MCVPRVCPDGHDCLCSKVAKFNLFNLMTRKWHKTKKLKWELCPTLIPLTDFVQLGQSHLLCIKRQQQILTWAFWLFFRRMTLTHFPVLPRFGSSWWIPDPLGISLVSTARAPLSAVPPEVRIQSFCIPGVNWPLKQMANLLLLKLSCEVQQKKKIFKCCSSLVKGMEVKSDLRSEGQGLG